MTAPVVGWLVVYVVHVWAWALYCGGVTYLYLQLFPDVKRWLASEDRFEQFLLVSADGLRWWIFGALFASGATGVALVLARAPAAPGRVWWVLVAAKAALLIVTLLLYAFVSYVMWPSRVFVAVADRAREQRRFARVAALLIALLLSQMLLGALAHLEGVS